MIKLSKTSKMPCKSFALPAGKKTCIGMIDTDGKIKAVCSKCYGLKGSYSWRTAKALREHNLNETLNNLEGFKVDMIKLLTKEKSDYFRWFDSGDVYDNDLLFAIYEICKNTPIIDHWIPTKARELLDQDLWAKLESLNNVTIRYSSPSINGYYQSIHGSTVIQKGQEVDETKVFKCPVVNERKKCDDCRACWNSDKVIAYTYH